MVPHAWLIASCFWSFAALGAAQDDASDTSAMLEQLTVAMVAKVVDANMVDIRSSADGKNLLRLGNTGLPKKGDAKLDEDGR